MPDQQVSLGTGDGQRTIGQNEHSLVTSAKTSLPANNIPQQSDTQIRPHIISLADSMTFLVRDIHTDMSTHIHIYQTGQHFTHFDSTLITAIDYNCLCQ